jgi:hypothetical protein
MSGFTSSFTTSIAKQPALCPALWSASLKTLSHRVKHMVKLQKHGSPRSWSCSWSCFLKNSSISEAELCQTGPHTHQKHYKQLYCSIAMSEHELILPAMHISLKNMMRKLVINTCRNIRGFYILWYNQIPTIHAVNLHSNFLNCWTRWIFFFELGNCPCVATSSTILILQYINY